MSGIRLTGLHIYPVKSARGTSLTEAVAESRGLRFDRRWLIVGQDGEFVTQRTEPRLATLGVAVREDGGVTLSADGYEDLIVPIPAPGATRMPTVIWSDTVDAQIADGEANAWLSAWLGRPVWLARMPDDTARPTVLAPEVNVSFADGYPYLLCSEESLAALSQQAEAPIPIDRFRPNIVVAGAEAWADEQWSHIRICGVVFECMKPCARCVVVTTDQTSGIRSGTAVLEHIAALRGTPDGKVIFGVNAVKRSGALLKVGDAVVIEG